MNKKRYISLKSIADFAQKNYDQFHTRTDFTSIIRFLQSSPESTDTPFKFRKADRYLSLEDFRNHAYTAQVDTQQIIENSDTAHIEEHHMIHTDKDVFTMLHLPYIQAAPHSHDYFEVNYVYSGSYTQFFLEEQKTFHKGDLVIIAPDSPHYVLADHQSLILCINIRKSTFNQTFWQLLENNDILSTFFKQMMYGNHTSNYLSFSIQTPEIYEPLLQQIYDETVADDEYGNYMAINLLNTFFIQLLRNFGNTIHVYNLDEALNLDGNFPLIMKYVQYNYATVSLAELSRVFHYSEVYLSQLFKKNLNQNFSHIVQNLKVSNAKKYLTTTSYKLSEIAHMVGYNSSDHLSKIFKKYYGISPSQYREKNQTSKQD